MSTALRIQVTEVGASPERVDAVTGFLRRELLQLDVDSVTSLPASPPPPGARGLDAVAVGGLLVTLTQSVEGLRAVVLAARDWLRRGDHTDRTIRLELAGDVLELSQATTADQQRLIDLFVSRHQARSDTS